MGERLRSAVAAVPLLVTASVGMAVIELGAGAAAASEVYERLFAEADAAMYAAKRNGGNQACVAQRDASDPAVDESGGPAVVVEPGER